MAFLKLIIPIIRNPLNRSPRITYGKLNVAKSSRNLQSRARFALDNVQPMFSSECDVRLFASARPQPYPLAPLRVRELAEVAELIIMDISLCIFESLHLFTKKERPKIFLACGALLN